MGALGMAHADSGTSHTRYDYMGLGISIGFGATGFSSDLTNDHIGTGSTMEVRGAFNISQPVAVEAAYRRSSNRMKLDFSHLSLESQGAEGAVRLNIGRFDLQPYVVAGAGWTWYERQVDEMDVEVMPEEEIFNVPAGVGVSFHVGQALVDIRSVYRFAMNTENANQVENMRRYRSLDTWSATAHVGMSF